MNQRVLGLAMGAMLAALALGALWRSRTTVFTYTVPADLDGSTIYLDGKRVGVAQRQVLELRLSEDRHTLRMDRVGQSPVLIEIDLSGRLTSTFTRD